MQSSRAKVTLQPARAAKSWLTELSDPKPPVMAGGFVFPNGNARCYRLVTPAIGVVAKVGRIARHSYCLSHPCFVSEQVRSKPCYSFAPFS